MGRRRRQGSPFIEALKQRANQEAEAAHIESMTKFRPGQKVKFKARGRLVIGVIVGSGRKRWTIHEDTEKGIMKWYVPARMLEVVEEGSYREAVEVKQRYDRKRVEVEDRLRGDFYPGQRVIWFSGKGTGRRSRGPRKGHRGVISHFASKRWVVVEDGGRKWYIPSRMLEPETKGGAA